MECPSCQAQIDEGSVVCPHCEAVVDPSLLNAMPPEGDGEETNRPPVKASEKPKVRKVVKKAGDRPSSGAAPAVKRSSRQSMPEAPPPAKAKKAADWRDAVPDEEWGNSRAPAAEVAPKEKTLDADDYLGQFKRFVARLNLADKLGFFGAVATFVSCFLPWRDSVAEGDTLGVGSAGFLVVLTAMATAGAVIMRTSKSNKINGMLLWVVQLGASGFGILWCFVCIRLAWDSTLVHAAIGNAQVWASKPSFGVYFAILAGAVSVVGTVLGLKESQPQ